MYCKEKEVSILLPVNLSNTKKILSTFVKIDTHTKTLIFLMLISLLRQFESYGHALVKTKTKLNAGEE